MAAIIQSVIALWNKGVSPEQISQELKCDQEKVEAIIDEPRNYKEGKSV